LICNFFDLKRELIMKKERNNINIIVDFDSILENIPPTGKNENRYKKCENYVWYEGDSVNGTTITLIKNKKYMFILQAKKGNKSIATKLLRFKDDDLILSRVSNDKLKLKCEAAKEDKTGKNVTMDVRFKDAQGNKCKASWDPTILVDTDPG